MLQVYGHPLSSYCWKVFVALRELGLDYELQQLDPDHPEIGAEFARRWPIAKMPLLVDGDLQFAESSVIVEYADLLAGGGRLIPADPVAALHVRFLDRMFDQYVMAPMQAFTVDFLRPAGAKDPYGIAQARALLDKAYAWLETNLPTTGWAAGERPTLADCAAAPSLYYADKVHPLAGRFPALETYLARLIAWPAFAGVVADAQPYWHMFPFADGPPPD
ncbi:glutathione S-transferase family protein [Sphingomonas sp. BIUV-7]|uniref:Glutathione S-transferase family protein n=1 Tax=Sphingomonas natans TaxID=3063330 RepID=A0ABT8YFL8_9SPHN|nr:glutathione S-transferase family protein [Sphingomonas sp. BIUV-7]MDO6416847.1 glutathione S-transferase family protein [Sphingomonas sp. BIUV-7]